MLKKLLKGSTIIWVSVIWAVVILAIAAGAFIFKPWQSQTQNTISVSASGKTQVTPNIAKLSATVSTNNDDLDLARQQNEEKVNNLISALRDLGIEDKDIQTQYISGGETFEIQSESTDVESQFVPPQPPPTRRKTNQVSTTFEVTIRDFTIADEAIAAFTQNGATNLNGPRLTVDDDTIETAKSDARKDAVANAKKKAQDLAEELNKTVGNPTNITEQGDFGFPVPIFAQAEADLIERSSQIQPGENDVTVTIQVDFELK